MPKDLHVAMSEARVESDLHQHLILLTKEDFQTPILEKACYCECLITASSKRCSHLREPIKSAIRHVLLGPLVRSQSSESQGLQIQIDWITYHSVRRASNMSIPSYLHLAPESERKDSTLLICIAGCCPHYRIQPGELIHSNLRVHVPYLNSTVRWQFVCTGAAHNKGLHWYYCSCTCIKQKFDLIELQASFLCLSPMTSLAS